MAERLVDSFRLTALSLIIGVAACSDAPMEECLPLTGTQDEVSNLFPLEPGRTWEYVYAYNERIDCCYPMLFVEQRGELAIEIVEITPCARGRRSIRTEHRLDYETFVRRDSSNGLSSYDTTRSAATYTYSWSDEDGYLRFAGGWPDYPNMKPYSSLRPPQFPRVLPDAQDSVRVSDGYFRDSYSWTFVTGVGLTRFNHGIWYPQGHSTSETWSLRVIR